MEIKIKKNEDGFLAICPSIQGAFAEGDTEFEALYNLLDVIKMITDYKKEKVAKGRSKNLSFTIPIAI